MSNSPRAAGDLGGDGKDGDKNEIEKTVAKTAGFVVFSGIAMSILKALNPFNNRYCYYVCGTKCGGIYGKNHRDCEGDTLWGLSREYGVSIDAIKEANGLTGDTIYAGKKLIIP
ncbi:hypothetical protein DH2020_031872 [Rehmannia glutinosa]|uniref:LysM domain-containing protein n=1 Tax=Rehmannia glutinosa TaxID=99300 RepID=A0ABR0VGU3_REHGL